jgi:hypothetical protein
VFCGYGGSSKGDGLNLAGDLIAEALRRGADPSSLVLHVEFAEDGVYAGTLITTEA